MPAAEIARRRELELGDGRTDGAAPLPVPTDRTILDWIEKGIIRADGGQQPWDWRDTSFGAAEARASGRIERLSRSLHCRSIGR